SVFFFQAEDGIRDFHVTGVQTCALPIYRADKQFIADSLTTISWSDSIQTKIITRFNLDSISYLKKIDSLKHLQLLPTTKYTQKRSEERRVGKECRTRW